MEKVDITEACEVDAIELIRNLRQADKEELEALDDIHPFISIINSIKVSDMCWTARVDGKLMAIFGVAPVNLLASEGRPWLIGTPLVDSKPKIFLENCENYIDLMADRYETMHNYVDARNVKSIRWLSWLGFEISEEEPYGKYGMPFHRFEMRN